ncbi:MAG: response regulator [Lachnospiraceae bacterium]|nr:response regulator [Lachnospiraceae bacterium]
MKIKVVVVDNAPELLEKMKGIFRNMENVELSGCFEEAVAVVDFVRENSVDMVFTDIVMPDISGISLASALHRLAAPPAVVLLSSIPGFSLEAWKIQAFGFIEKPYTRKDVIRMVENYGREREKQIENR